MEHFEDQGFHYLAFEYIKDSSDLFCIFEKRNLVPFVFSEAKVIFAQLIRALSYCHLNGVAHRDLKLENIVVDSQLKVTLIDFGLSECNLDTHTTSSEHCGSLDYAPPEIIYGKTYSPIKADIWSAGVVLFTLLFAEFPFDCRTGHIDYTSIEFPKPITMSMKKLIKGMLDPNPDTRMTLKEIMTHPFLASTAAD